MRYRIETYADGTCKVKYRAKWWPFWRYVIKETFMGDPIGARRFDNKGEAEDWINRDIAYYGHIKIRNTKVSEEDYP